MGRPDGRPWIEVGANTRVAYVFSCPGYEEASRRRPAAKQTGEHLDQVIAILHEWNLLWIPTREDATVADAWPRVEHKRAGGTGRRVPTEAEVLRPDNLARLERELKEITDWIICFGDEARWAVQELKGKNRLLASCRVAHVRHLSHYGLIPIKTTLDGLPLAEIPDGQKRREQLRVTAAELARSLDELPPGISIPDQPTVHPYLQSEHGSHVAANTGRLHEIAHRVREQMETDWPGFPDSYCQNASVALAMVLAQMGVTAWTVRGRVQLDLAIPLDRDEPDVLYAEPTHWWVESCGWWIDLTFDQFSPGLHHPPESVCMWPSHASVRHLPGIDDHEDSNSTEAEIRRSAATRRLVDRIVRQLRR